MIVGLTSSVNAEKDSREKPVKQVSKWSKIAKIWQKGNQKKLKKPSLNDLVDMERVRTLKY